MIWVMGEKSFKSIYEVAVLYPWNIPDKNVLPKFFYTLQWDVWHPLTV